MKRNGAVCDIYCNGEGTVNAANEVADEPVKAFPGVPGRLRALRGRELEQAQQIKANISWEFECRQDGVTPDMWLCQHGTGRLLNVEISIPDEREINHRILCSERVR